MAAHADARAEPVYRACMRVQSVHVRDRVMESGQDVDETVEETATRAFHCRAVYCRKPAGRACHGGVTRKDSAA